MNNEFVTYKQALALKEIGYDQISYFGQATSLYNKESYHTFYVNYGFMGSGLDDGYIYAPLKQQVFKWFRDKHEIKPQITTTYDEWDFYIPTSKYNEIPIRQGSDIWTYEQAEDACIDKLIELIKNKNDE